MPLTPPRSVKSLHLSLLAVLILVAFAGCSKKPTAYIIGYLGSQAGINGAVLAAEQAAGRRDSPYKSVKIVGIDTTAFAFDVDKALKSLNDAGAQIIIDGSGSLVGTEPKSKAVILATGQNPKASLTIEDPLESAAAKMADQLWADEIYSVSIVYDLADLQYNKKWINAFHSRYQKNRGVILKAETVNSLQEGWEKRLPLTLKELPKESRCLIVVAATEAAALIIQEARNLNKDIPLALAEQAFHANLISKAGNNLEGAMMVDFPPPAKGGKSYGQFAKDYAGKYDAAANLTAAAAYDAVGLIIAASEKSKRVADGIAAQTEYQGVMGTARNNSGNFNRESRLGRIINGRFSPIVSASSPKP